jgi:hypothetical protein
MTDEQMNLMVDTWICKKPKLNTAKKMRFINMRDYNSNLIWKYRKDITMKKDLFNLIMRCRERYLAKHASYCNAGKYNQPKTFLVGTDKNQILSNMVPVFSHGGCHQMPKIDANEFALAVTELTSYNLTPTALLRIGIFHPYYTSTRGDVLYDLKKFGHNFFLLSFGVSYYQDVTIFTNPIYRIESNKTDYNLIIKED